MKPNVLMISMDRQLFNPASAAAKRQARYGEIAQELHIIVFARRDLNLTPTSLAANVTVYPTNSNSRWRYIQDAVRLGRKLAKRHSVDLVTAMDSSECGLAGYLVARALRRPLHLQVHTDIFSPYFVRHSLLNWLRVWLGKFLLQRAGSVRAVSERIRLSLVSRMGATIGDRITVLPILVTPPAAERLNETIRSSYPQFKNIALVIARLEPEKNVTGAITAFSRSVADFPQAGLVIVGDGSQRAELVRQVKGLGLTNKVIFVGWQSDLERYYRGADILISSSYYEGYSLTLVEAAQVGLAIVTTDVGAVGYELPRDTMKVCPVGDEAAMVAAIRELLSDETLRRNLGSRAALAGARLTQSMTDYLSWYQASWLRALKK